MLLAESTRLLSTRLSSSLRPPRRDASIGSRSPDLTTRTCYQASSVLTRSLREEGLISFPTWLGLLRLIDSLHHSSDAKGLTLNTRSPETSRDGLNDAIRGPRVDRLCDEVRLKASTNSL